MSCASSARLSCELQLQINNSRGCGSLNTHTVGKGGVKFVNINLSSRGVRHNAWRNRNLNNVNGPVSPVPSRLNIFVCRSVLTPGGNEMTVAKSAAAAILTRSSDALRGSPFVIKLIPAVGIIAFAVWGIGPLMRLCRIVFLHEPDNSWKKSSTHYVMTSYLQPLLLWTGATLICRALDPVVLPSEASQAVKQRIMTFVRSLSTVLAFAYCFSSLIQQARKFFAEANDNNDTRSMGFDFAGKAIYTAVWVAAVSLFMELLGFSTQKWLTAGGLGTVLLTLAGREIFTNFLSSVMIHATRPFVVNEWIQTKIEGYEVSGTVEHVGWWSPTIIRGDDREAVHIPNHKFTVNVVRNLSQKTHWRIKTYVAISHLDVHKINNIVADMRKVLAKNSQVEQQRLHRRVFLENINPENQALMILISCFVKTSHFEEYLCVKETIILDLLRVVSHHRARLATPIRTVQKIYNEPDLENVPFADTIFARSRAAANRPLLLIEPSNKVNGNDKIKASNQSVQSNEDKDRKLEAASDPDSKVKTGAGFELTLDSKGDNKFTTKTTETSNINSKIQTDSVTEPQIRNSETDKRSMGDAPKDAGGSKCQGKAPGGVSVQKTSFTKQESGSGESSLDNLGVAQDVDRSSAASPVRRPPLEDNIVLGVALEGSKRTLPIEEEEMIPSSLPESEELASSRSSGVALGKDREDSPMPTAASTTKSD